MLSWFYPIILEKRKSEFNGEIDVVKSFGKISVRVGGFEQSGPMVEKIWGKALKNILAKRVLILGYGAGIIARFFPNSEIVGIEIDPEMISIGKKYFPSRANIILSDAKNIPAGKFDLIVVDIYTGKEFPQFFETIPFLETLKKKGSKVVFNRLKFNRKVDLNTFEKNIRSVFKNVKITTVDFNTFFTVK